MYFMNSIKIPDKCFQCGKSYKKKDADLLNESENVYTFHITCSSCKSSAILKVSVSIDGILSVLTLTDAGKNDLDKLRSDKSISADDIIEAYVSIKKALPSTRQI